MKRTVMKLFALAASIALILTAAVPAFAAEESAVITFTDDGATVSGSEDGISIDGADVKITESGTYIFTGSCRQGSIVVKKNVTGVTLVLDGLTLTASATAPITCNKGSGVTIVAAEGSVNTLADDEYNNDDVYTDTETYPDIENAVIKCKDGSVVTICGAGTINVNAYGKNGVKGGADLYEEDEDGNATDTLLSESSLTIKDVTLNVAIKHSYKDPEDPTAYDGDAIKSEKELNILSGNVTVSANDDGIKCDYVMNIGEERTEGPEINVTDANEGIEAATLNIYSGNIRVNASDDGINAANGDIAERSEDFSYNQYGGYVYVNVTNGDGIDSNGSANLAGGVLEIYSPAQGDGDPIDTEYGVAFGGATVLAVGHNAMMQTVASAGTPYVTFGESSGMGGGMRSGFGGMQSNAGEAAQGNNFGGMQNNAGEEMQENGFGGTRNGMNGGAAIVTAGNTVEIRDADGNTLYTATAVRDASYVLFASAKLTENAAYTLYNGTEIAATATAGTSDGGGMPGPGGNMPGDGQTPPDGEAPTLPDGSVPTPPDGEAPTPPDWNDENRPTPPDGETPTLPDGSVPTPPDGESPSDPPVQPSEDPAGTSDRLPGDVNGDGKVNSQDARLALRAAAKLETLDDASFAAADVNGDGKITSTDARTILRAAAKIESL